MAIFRFFKTTAAAIFDFRNFKFLTVGRITSVELRHCAKFCQTVEPQPRYCDFSIYQDGGDRHLGFSKFQIFNSQMAQEESTASLHQIWWKSVKPLPR